MAILGQIVIESVEDIRECLPYVSQAIPARCLSKLLEEIFDQINNHRLFGNLKILVPVCNEVNDEDYNHWTLLVLDINEGLIESITHLDSCGPETDITSLQIKREIKTPHSHWYQFFKGCSPYYFDAGCRATYRKQATQTSVFDDTTCLDRVIINILNILNLRIKGGYSKDECTPKKIRERTASIICKIIEEGVFHKIEPTTTSCDLSSQLVHKPVGHARQGQVLEREGVAESERECVSYTARL